MNFHKYMYYTHFLKIAKPLSSKGHHVAPLPNVGVQFRASKQKKGPRLPKRHGKLALHAAAGRFDEDEQKALMVERPQSSAFGRECISGVNCNQKKGHVWWEFGEYLIQKNLETHGNIYGIWRVILWMNLDKTVDYCSFLPWFHPKVVG